MMRFLKRNKGLTLIVLAAILLEMVSGLQYYYMHDILDHELERHAETELTLKCVLTKSTLNMAENSLKGHIWDIERNIAHADSMYDAVEWVLRSHPNLLGCGIAFVPYHYPEKGRLYEPYALWQNGEVVRKQIAGENHDYTKVTAFSKAFHSDKPTWTDPYMDDITGKRIVTYTLPIFDEGQNRVGVFGLDISLDWLSDTLNHRHIFPSSFNILLTESNILVTNPKNVIARPLDVERVASMIADSTVTKELSRSKRTHTFAFTSAYGDKGIVFYHYFKGKPRWQVAVVYYEDDIYAMLGHTRLRIMLLMLIGFSVLGFIIYRYFKSEKNLQQTRLKQERIDSELQIAQRIQMDMLPKKFPPYPDRHDVDIYGLQVPAKEVGGDLFDFVLRDEKLYFCIGDVSGKGVPSALIMAGTHSWFRMNTAHHSNPAHIMKIFNEAACEGNESCMFVTLFIGVLDLPTGRLRYCNAGHDMPLLLQSSEVSELPCEANLPIGLFADVNYKLQETTIAPGTTIFLYTDGLTEAKNSAREQYGLKRVRQALEGLRRAPSQPLLEEMVRQTRLFVKDAEQSDDLTMLAIGYTRKESVETLHDSITLKNDVHEVVRLKAFMVEVGNKLELGKSLSNQLKLAVEEAVVNVIDYAYPVGKEGEISIEAKADGEQLRIVIADSGAPFDPTGMDRADTTLSAEERPIGGLGILLVRELMDSINYERTDGRNILTLLKNYKAQ